MKKQDILWAVGFLALGVASFMGVSRYLSHSAGHEGMKHEGMKNMFMQKAEVDGYSVTFHVMPASPDLPMGGSHYFMVKIEHGGAPQELQINATVIFPDETSVTKTLTPRADWYMAGYDLGKPGNYQLMITFDTPNGTKHQGWVNYSPGGI